jgi:hypothetical protein
MRGNRLGFQCQTDFYERVKKRRRDAVPQNPEDWLMMLRKLLISLSFTVNSALKVNSLTTPPFLSIVIELR